MIPSHKVVFFMKIDRDGVRIAAILLGFSVLGAFFSSVLTWILVAFTLFTLYFFRDPDRFFMSNLDILLSPADGKVLYVKKIPFSQLQPEVAENFSDKTEYFKISIFMNVFNVHVNRAPTSGIVEKVNYIQGKFFNASLDKASEFNERCIYGFKTLSGAKIVFVQIAGLIARRIRRDVKEGAEISQGQRFGLIRYGSRVDVYLPVDKYEVLVVEKQTTIAGETQIARKIS